MLTENGVINRAGVGNVAAEPMTSKPTGQSPQAKLESPRHVTRSQRRTELSPRLFWACCTPPLPVSPRSSLLPTSFPPSGPLPEPGIVKTPAPRRQAKGLPQGSRSPPLL